MGKITIDNFFGIWRNADQPDLPDGYFSELKDLIGRNGKLEKTFDFGGATADITIPSGYTVYGLATFIHDELTNDYSYILVLINATFQVKIYVYSGTVWYELSDGSGMNVTYGTYYHKKDRNPIIQTHDAIRILPGNVSKAYSTNESKGIWLGYLNRNYFWNSAIKTITGFKSYDSCLEHSAYSLLSVVGEATSITTGTHTAGGASAYLLDSAQNFIPNILVGLMVHNVTDGSSGTITANDETIVVATLTGGTDNDWDTNDVYYIGYSNGLIADTYYYKIVPVFDGVQEALLPDDFKSVIIRANEAARLQHTFQSLSTFNGRLTGFNIYRASDTDTAYYKILEVNILDTDPGLDYKADSIVGYGLYVPNAGWTDDALNLKGIAINDMHSYIIGNSSDCIMIADPLTIYENCWGDYYSIWDDYVDYACGFEDGTVDGWVKISGTAVANDSAFYHSGYKCLRATQNPGVHGGDAQKTVTGLTENTTYYVQAWVRSTSSQTGTLWLDGVSKDTKTIGTEWVKLSGSVATGGGDTDVVIYIEGSSTALGVYIDDVVLAEGSLYEEGENGYCGINTIINYNFELGIEDSKANYRVLANDSDGNNDATDFRRRITNNVRRAVRVYSDFSGTAIGITRKSYICRNYLWQLNASGVDLWVYDDGLLPSPATTDKHPLLNEVSIKVNGELAMLYKGRLWQAVLVLDPGGEGEEHTEWIGYSYLTSTGDPCYDINPVSNIYPLPDREGGKITGWAAGFDSIFIFKAHSIFRLVISDITDPTSWVLKESNFDVGNLAKQGVVTVGNTTYFCAYDGIHTLDPNVGAETSQSPTLRDIITEPIRDIYIALSDDEKAAIQGEYDQINREIIWRFTSASIWAYHTDTQQWRQKDTNQVIDLMGYDENSNILVYNNTDKKVYNIDTNGAVGIALRTKDYQISDDDKVVVRFITVVYKSVTALTLNFYTDNDDSTVRATATLPVSTTITQLTVAIRYYCNRFNVEIIDEVNSTTDTQINKLIIEHGD